MPCPSSTNQQLLPTRCNTYTHTHASCATLSGNWRLNCCCKIAKEKNLKSISLFRCNWSAANYLIASWQYSNFLKSLNANYLWLSSSARDNCRSYSVCAAFQIHQPEVKRISEQKQFFMQIVCLLASTLRYYIFFFALLYSLLLLVVAFTHLSLVWWCIACLHIALHDILRPFNIVSMREGNGTTTTT